MDDVVLDGSTNVNIITKHQWLHQLPTLATNMYIINHQTFNKPLYKIYIYDNLYTLLVIGYLDVSWWQWDSNELLERQIVAWGPSSQCLPIYLSTLASCFILPPLTIHFTKQKTIEIDQSGFLKILTLHPSRDLHNVHEQLELSSNYNAKSLTSTFPLHHPSPHLRSLHVCNIPHMNTFNHDAWTNPSIWI